MQGFDDILNTDHKLISFDLSLEIQKKPKVKRLVYNFKKANWAGLKEQLTHAPWDECFVPSNIDESLSNWFTYFSKPSMTTSRNIILKMYMIIHGLIRNCYISLKIKHPKKKVQENPILGRL